MELELPTTYPYSEQRITHSSFDYIYISPHLDDVPLSCSGTICRQQAQGLNILVVTIFAGEPQPPLDRKSTRLNSSHSQISYAVFCLKKKILPDLTADHLKELSGGVIALWRSPQMASIYKMVNRPSIAIVDATPRTHYGGPVLAASYQ